MISAMAIATYDSGCRSNTIHRNDNYNFSLQRRSNRTVSYTATAGATDQGANRRNKDYRPQEEEQETTGWTTTKQDELNGIKNAGGVIPARTKRNRNELTEPKRTGRNNRN